MIASIRNTVALSFLVAATKAFTPSCYPPTLNSYPWEWHVNVNGTSTCGDVWYLLIPTYQSWSWAENYCQYTHQGHLASILSEDENDFLLDQYQYMAKPFAWIGLNKDYLTQEHTWSDGACVDYMGPEGSLEADSGNGDCVGMFYSNGDSNGQWHYSDCNNDGKNFICEYRCPTTPEMTESCPEIVYPCEQTYNRFRRPGRLAKKK